jgi:regulator of protease activity HflC (stomatin/prohibitin superfamily)
MEELLWVVLIAVLVAAGVALARGLFARVTVFEWERGLRYHKGRLRETLEPGQYRIYRRTTDVFKIDTRPRFVTVPGQEVLSADGVTLRVSLAAEFEVADPETAMNRVEDFQQALYLTLQLGLRDLVGGAEIDDVLAKREDFGRLLTERAAPEVEEYGMRLRSVDLKDIMFPGDLKRVFARVVEARKEGQRRSKGPEASQPPFATSPTRRRSWSPTRP